MSSYTLLGTASVAALLGGAYYASGFIFSGWANNDRFFTKVKEGTGKVIVKGKSFHRAILSLKDHHLNEPGTPWHDPDKPDWEILPNEPGINYDRRDPMTRSFGLHWVGIPGQRSVYHYHFVWNEYRGVPGGEQEVWHRDEDTSIFMANAFTYVMVLENVKTSDNVPVRAEFSIIVRITNPYLALFSADSWKVLLESYVDRQGRNFIGTYSYDQLRSETDEFKKCEEENFSKPIVKLTLELPEEKVCDTTGKPRGLKGKYGVVIEAANMAKIDLFGVFAARNEEVSTKLYVAENEAKAARIGADAAAYVVRAGANANAHKEVVEGAAAAAATEMLMRTLEKRPELARAKLAADAMAKPGDGKTVVIPSDIGDAISGVFGKRRG